MNRVGKRSNSDRGQAILEVAIVLPLLLVMVMGIVDFGLGLRDWITVTNATREGARVAAIGSSCSSIRQRVKDASSGLITSDSEITISPSDCKFSSGDSAKVTVQYSYKLLTPLAGLLNLVGASIDSTIPIQSSSSMRVE